MGMTIDEVIRYIKDLRDARGCGYQQATIAISTMRKYQKIQEILNSASYTENGTVYSYTYDEDTRVKHIREVLEDGNDN